MCGFIGVVRAAKEQYDRATLDRARDLLTHRGPDDAGAFQDERIYLGFRRLSILDLSRNGGQPMSDQDERYWIVFNGEIYNYVELRQALEKQGQVFQTGTDTEVVLRLYMMRGTQMLAALNGMFALAIYDRKRGTVCFARDRVGKKPLFYWKSARGIAFASELKALRQLPDFPKELDPSAVGLYLRLGWVPSWKSIHRCCGKLPPASYCLFDVEAADLGEPQTYWSLPKPIIDLSRTQEQWLEELDALLADATAIRLRADVPVATFLSGGIDSSLVTAATAAAAPRGVQALTVGFPGWGDDEWPLAQATARHLGVPCVHLPVSGESADLLPSVIAHFDEPFADGSALPTALVCREARKHCTVVLSGDGGDEVFAGYPAHLRAWRWRHVDRIPNMWRRLLSETFAGLAAGDTRARRALRRFGYPVGRLGMGATIYPFEDWLAQCVRSPYQTSAAAVADAILEAIPSAPIAPPGPVDDSQRMDMRLYMHDDILVKVDRMSMMNSLEVRSPLLDYRLIELALSVPPRLRVAGGRENKHLLRQLARRKLPPQTCEAPKRGFGIPLRQMLLEGGAAQRTQDVLSAGGSPVLSSVLKAGSGETLLERARADDVFLGIVLRLLCLHWWHEGVE